MLATMINLTGELIADSANICGRSPAVCRLGSELAVEFVAKAGRVIGFVRGRAANSSADAG